MLQQFLSDIFNKMSLSKLKSAPVYLFLCFLLVFVQSAALIHNHDGDLQSRFDCDICLKVNGTDQAIASAQFEFVIASGAPQIAIAQYSASISTTPSFRARAPPLSV